MKFNKKLLKKDKKMIWNFLKKIPFVAFAIGLSILLILGIPTGICYHFHVKNMWIGMGIFAGWATLMFVLTRYYLR